MACFKRIVIIPVYYIYNLVSSILIKLSKSRKKELSHLLIVCAHHLSPTLSFIQRLVAWRCRIVNRLKQPKIKNRKSKKNWKKLVAIGERNEILNETFGHIVWCPLLVAMRQSEARYKTKMLLCMSVTVKWTDWLIELTVIDLPTPSLNGMMLPNMCVCVCQCVWCLQCPFSCVLVG